jgi:preprotein translocase subunit Sec61beta
MAKKKKQGGPVSSAGLMRYFDTEESHIKISPRMVVIASIIVAAIVMGLNLSMGI